MKTGAASDLVELAARERAANALVHPARGEFVGAFGERLRRRFDRVGIVARRDRTQRGDQTFERDTLVGVEQFAVGRKRRFRRFDQTLRFDLCLAQRPRAHIDFRRLEAVFEHARDVVVGEPIRRLHDHRCLHARMLLARKHGQQTVRIDLIGDADARRARRHRRNAAQLEARERTAIGHEFALALDDVNRHRRLAVLEGREFLRACDGNGRVARDDLLGEAAHRFDAERQRNHVEQQPVVAVGAAVAREQVGLDRRAERDDLIWIEIGQRRLAEKVFDRAADHRHARRAADEHDAVDIGRRQLRVAQRLFRRAERALNQRLCDCFERRFVDGDVDLCGACERYLDRSARRRRQRFLRDAHRVEQQAHVLGRQRLGGNVSLLQHMTIQRVIEVVAAERRIAARREYFENALRELQNGQIERAAAKVVHRVQTFRAVIETVGDRGRRRLVQQTQHVQAGETRGILGRLALRFVEIRGHRDHRADQLVAERVFRAIAQRRENFGGHFDGTLHAVDGADLHHARCVDEIVRRVFRVLDFALAASHEALDRDDRIARIGSGFRFRRAADAPAALLQISHDGRQQIVAFVVGQYVGHAAAHRRDERVGRAKVDADRETPLMRRGRHAGFRNLQ
ncbi:NAD-specific glutamate dehydrogenase [Paraburkholderia hospita]|uniref:NAD-specific glutamate dehydrogenase n=1 Tax=Paraburkholderia hospita TaxID=169430 RepID=A0ABP2PIZ8_9BURK|nr:NAD-specific glutamate dehydrogenase [Paraburkholderia hospita]